MLEGQTRDVIFTGDAAKNRTEIVSRAADMTYDQSVSRQSIEGIWELWRKRPGTIIVPGHDVPMMLDNGEPKYLSPREGAIASWFGDTLDQLKVFDLTA